MLNPSQITSIYPNVCQATGGDGFHIEYMPEFFDNDPDDNSLPHVHTFYEIIWFQEAGGVHTVDFTDYEIQANSLCFLSPGQVHRFDGKTRHKGIQLKFCTDFMRDENGDEDIFLKYNVFNAFDKSPFVVIRDEHVAKELEKVIWRMQEEERHSLGGCPTCNDFAHMDMLRALVRIFLIYVHRYGQRLGVEKLDTMKPSHRLFVQFRRKVEQNYRTLHTVGEYADLLNVSSKTLSNSVLECSKKTPLAFINDRIILEAKRLLQFTDLMVKEVAYKLGYDDPSYFVKFFKRQTGELPTKLRTRPQSL